MAELIQFTEDQLKDFKRWVGLNYEAITWQGRFASEFENFWIGFFIPEQSLSQVMTRFEYALLHAQIGPLSSWFTWLRNSFVCYTWIYKKLTILELSQRVNISFDQVGMILRNFFLEHFPEYEEELSERFKVANMISPNLELTYDILKEELDLDERAERTNIYSILNSMEVTLYPSWQKLIAKMEKDLIHPNFDFSRIKSNLSFGKHLKIFGEILIFLVLGVLLVKGIQYANKYLESSLLEKISIYEPQLKWLDRTLTFKESDNFSRENFELGAKELEQVETNETKFEELNIDDDNMRYEEESDVSLTSWDSLPKDFDVVTLEQSDYEEHMKGYRDSRYGNTKVYRVLMRSVDTYSTKNKLNNLLEKYGVTQVDNVRPGKSVPGGIYYNLFVPREYLKEFMAQVMDFDDAILYESRTRSGNNPPGQNKVFIWVKNI